MDDNRTKPNEIISYIEMCQREGLSLQRGMNFHIGGRRSVILMSLRPNAPYLIGLKMMVRLLSTKVMISQKLLESQTPRVTIK